MKPWLIRLTSSEPPLKLPGKHLKTRSLRQKLLSPTPRSQLTLSSMQRSTRSYWPLKLHSTRKMRRQRKYILT